MYKNEGCYIYNGSCSIEFPRKVVGVGVSGGGWYHPVQNETLRGKYAPKEEEEEKIVLRQTQLVYLCVKVGVTSSGQ